MGTYLALKTYMFEQGFIIDAKPEEQESFATKMLASFNEEQRSHFLRWRWSIN